MKKSVLAAILLVALFVILLIGSMRQGKADPLVLVVEGPAYAEHEVLVPLYGPREIRPSARAERLARWAARMSGGDYWTPEGGILAWVEAATLATESPHEQALLVAQALAEGGFARDVLSGACNTMAWQEAHCPRNRSCDTGYSCDGGIAKGPYQVHPDQPAVWRAHLKAEDLRDPDKATPIVLTMLRTMPGAWTTHARARAIAMLAPSP
jgi:hypothetical protein